MGYELGKVYASYSTAASVSYTAQATQSGASFDDLVGGEFYLIVAGKAYRTEVETTLAIDHRVEIFRGKDSYDRAASDLLDFAEARVRVMVDDNALDQRWAAQINNRIGRIQREAERIIENKYPAALTDADNLERWQHLAVREKFAIHETRKLDHYLDMRVFQGKISEEVADEIKLYGENARGLLSGGLYLVEDELRARGGEIPLAMLAPFYEVDIEVPNSASAAKGQTITLTATVTNLGRFRDWVWIEAEDLGRAWKAWFENLDNAEQTIECVELVPGASIEVALKIKVPNASYVVEGEIYVVIVEAYSDINRGRHDREEISVAIGQPHGVRLEVSPSTAEGAESETIRFDVTLTNTGLADDTINLSADTPGNWVALYKLDNGEVTSVSLVAGESVQLRLEVTITNPSKSGNSYQVTARATSASDSSVYDEQELTVTVT
jgi:hypothetical protein